MTSVVGRAKSSCCSPIMMHINHFVIKIPSRVTKLRVEKSGCCWYCLLCVNFALNEKTEKPSYMQKISRKSFGQSLSPLERLTPSISTWVVWAWYRDNSPEIGQNSRSHLRSYQRNRRSVKLRRKKNLLTLLLLVYLSEFASVNSGELSLVNLISFSIGTIIEKASTSSLVSAWG